MARNFSFKLSAALLGVEAAAIPNATWDYILSIEDELGKQLNAQILTAYVGQKQVKLTGADLCDLHSGIETFRRIEMY